MQAGLSVVVPVYNSGATLPLLAASLVEHLEGVGEYEVVLVDDGSVDDSWKVIQALSDELPVVRGVQLAYNAGEQSATLCGIAAARFDTIVTMDDDLQHDPSSIPALLAALEDDVELVYGLPDRDQHSFGRRAASRVAKPSLEHVFKVRGAGSNSAFRAFRTELRDRFPGAPGPMSSVDAMLANAGPAMTTVVVPHHPRRMGRSHYTTLKLLSHTMNLIADGSPSPLLFATVTGVACMVGGVLGVFGVVVAAVLGSLGSPVPWVVVALASIVLGVVLVALGILGELAVRILARAGGSPAYVVRRTTGDSDS